jgi:pyridoxamine 5'-phosphate oxidase
MTHAPLTTASPLRVLERWIADARALGVKDPDAMTLATATTSGAPSARIVLCRGITDDELQFFTNYESKKGRQLEDNGVVAAVFHWRELARQVKVEGVATRAPAAVSDAYFASRPRGSQLAARVSPQSRPIESLVVLREERARLETELEGRAVERPAHWGGYCVRATAVELWQAGEHRLHDCVRYERVADGWTSWQVGP